MHNPKERTPDWEDGFSTSYSDVINHQQSDYVVWESSNTKNSNKTLKVDYFDISTVSIWK